MSSLPPLVSCTALAALAFLMAACSSGECQYKAQSGKARVVEFDNEEPWPGIDCPDPRFLRLDFIDSKTMMRAPSRSEYITNHPSAPRFVERQCLADAGIEIGSEFEVTIRTLEPATEGCDHYQSVEFAEELLVCNDSCR